jgi:Flp pilus assembly pilin Flp
MLTYIQYKIVKQGGITMKMKNQKRSVIRFKNQKGQAVVEYVIIIVVVALAALLVLTAFSDRLRAMIAGVTNTLGGEATAQQGDTKQMLQDLQAEGAAEDMQ